MSVDMLEFKQFRGVKGQVCMNGKKKDGVVTELHGEETSSYSGIGLVIRRSSDEERL